MADEQPGSMTNQLEGAGEFLTGRIVSDGDMIDDGVVAYSRDRIAYAGTRAGFQAWTASGEGSTVSWQASQRSEPNGYLIPGLVDAHCHGAVGGDFSTGSESANRRAAAHLHASGTTTLLASTMSVPQDQLLRALAVLAPLVHEGLIGGIHAEGPFLSATHCGAQNPDFLRAPDPDALLELIEAADGTLSTMTYAPEIEGAAMLVDLLTTHGITPSLGHTGCDATTAEASLAQACEEMDSAGFDGYSGRPTVTHLFNGMAPMHHRMPGPVPVALRSAAAGNAIVELIGDGVHLDPQTVRTVFDLVGAANIALVSDSMAATGLPDGTYTLGGAPVTVTGGRAVLDATGSLAGGTASLLDVVRHSVAAGVALPDALTSATVVPAGILGLADEVGSLRHGLRADVLVVTGNLELRAVLRCGHWIDVEPRTSKPLQQPWGA